MAGVPVFLDQSQIVFHSGGIIFTDDYNFAQDEKSLWKGTHKMFARIETLSADLPKKLSSHPLFTSLFLESLSISGAQAGWVQVTGNYVGLLSEAGGEPDDNDPRVRYSLGISLSEDPLETFGAYVNELTPLEIQQASEWAKNPPKDEDGEVKEPDLSEWPAKQVELYNFLQAGLVSYRVPRATWTMSWVSNSRPSNLNSVGKIDNPPGAPSVNENRDWLNAGITSNQAGRVYENSIVWELSGIGGWVSEIYG